MRDSLQKRSIDYHDTSQLRHSIYLLFVVIEKYGNIGGERDQLEGRGVKFKNHFNSFVLDILIILFRGDAIHGL